MEDVCEQFREVGENYMDAKLRRQEERFQQYDSALTGGDKVCIIVGKEAVDSAESVSPESIHFISA